MPSEVDQAAPQQSIEERIGEKLWGNAPEESVPEVDDTPEDTVEDQAEDEPVQEEQKSPAIDEVEIEVEGWRGKIPAKLKAEIDKGADYTRKTQALAEEKRLADQERRLYYEQQAFQQAASKEIDELRQVETQLEQFRSVDLSQVDGDTLSRMSMAAANLRERRAQLGEAVAAKRGEFTQKTLAAWDQMATQAREVIVKSVPNWDSVAGQVAQFALQEGFQFEHITGHDRTTRQRVGPGVVDPVFAKTLYKAMQWDKLQASKATSTAKVANAPPVVKPGATDTRAPSQVGLMNFKKALKGAGSDSRKAEIIGDRVASKFFR